MMVTLQQKKKSKPCSISICNMKITETNSNLIFLLTIGASIYKNEFVYLILSISIFITSYFYHFAKDNIKYKSHILSIRYADIFVAVTSCVYMFYFIHSYVSQYQSLLYFLLFITLLLFVFGKTKQNKIRNLHSYFHIAIGLVSSLIVLLK